MPKPPKDPPIPAEPPRKRRGPKPGTKRGPRRASVGAASFAIDDAGRMEIRDGQQSIRLEADDVQRLWNFLTRTRAAPKK